MTGEQEKFAQSNDPSNGSEHPSRPKLERTKAIQELNDRLRKAGRGGMIHMTNGVAALGLSKVDAIFKAIADFSNFTPDNDPWSEHDCAVVEFNGERLIWKIDYYDRSRTYHSPDPGDPKVTVRVMTVMLASEY